MADPERHAADKATRRRNYANNPTRRTADQERNHWNLTSVQYARKLLVNRRHKALGRLSERNARSEERQQGG